MRKLILSLIVSALILVLTTSTMTILPVTSQDTDLILDKLEELYNKLEGEEPALQNKVNAVINQVEAGNLNGALNKLQNDVKKSVIAWVEDPELQQELINLIDEIIDLIEGITPPPTPEPDFEITTSPYRLDVIQGGFNTTSIMITSVNNFSAEVILSSATSTPEITITLDPTVLLPLPNATAASTLIVNATQTAALGNYMINITGTSGTLEHSVTVSLRITEAPPPKPDFTITASPAVLITQQGGSNTSIVTVASVHGFDKRVDLAVTSTQSGVNATLYPQAVTPLPDVVAIAILILDIASEATIGTYNITVTGTGDSLQRSVIVTLVVTAPPVPPMPDFNVQASPTMLTVEQGDATSSTIIVASLKGFNKTVELASDPKSISGVTLSLHPTRISLSPAGFNTSTLKIKVAAGTLPQELEINITGTSGTLEHSVIVSLRITEAPPPKPDFTITASPTILSIEQGHSNTSVITVTAANGFDKQVDLMISSAPVSGVNATLNPNTVTLESAPYAISILTLGIATDAVIGSYNISVTGASGFLQHDVNITLTITAPPVPPEPDFSINAYPTTLTIEQGDTASLTIIVASLRGFSAAVDLTLIPESVTGVTLSLDATQITPLPNDFVTSTLRIEITEDAPTNEYEITVTGTSGTLQPRSVSISLSIIVERKPPIIVSVSRIPANAPAYNETVKILANVVDTESGVRNATLRYSRGEVQQDIPMILSAGLYEATIPKHSFGTVIEYSVNSFDNAGNPATSNRVTYIVADPYQPLIGDLTWIPQDPIVNDDIAVNVTVTEPEDASGVDQVILRYSNTTGVYSIPMTDNHDGNWTAVIGNQTGSKVTLVVEAVDKAGNEIESDIHEFKVKTLAFPLVWILAAIALLAAATGGGAYYVRRRKKKGAAATSVPSAQIKSISLNRP